MLGGGFPIRTLSVCAAGSQFPIISRFCPALFSSRTVGFPESGWRRQPFHDSPSRTSSGLSARSHTPSEARLSEPLRCPLACSAVPRHCIRMRGRATAAAHREPLCASLALPYSPGARGASRQALSCLHRSYGLMRQTVVLPSASVFPIPSGLCRLLRAPAAQRPFPSLSLLSSRRCLDPYPGCPSGALTRFFPEGCGLPYRNIRSALGKTPHSDFRAARDFGAAVIPLCSGPRVCSPS